MTRKANRGIEHVSPGSEVEAQPGPRGCLDRRNAAAYLSCSTRYLDNLLSQGIIPKGKLGRKTVVRISDLDAFIDSKVQRLKSGDRS